jgi:lipopolysaccharide biosynthesis regulator YciM
MLTLTQVAAAIVTAETVVANAVSAIGAAVAAVSVIVADVKKLIAYVPTLMQTFENAYAQAGDPNNGAGKLAGVLAALEALAVKLAVDWSDSIKAVVANIVAQAKAAYNAVANIGSGSTQAA